MMVNNAGDVFKLCISTKKHRQALKLVKIKEKAHTVDMRIIYHINDILNDSLLKFLHADLLSLHYSNFCLSRVC